MWLFLAVLISFEETAGQLLKENPSTLPMQLILSTTARGPDTTVQMEDIEVLDDEGRPVQTCMDIKSYLWEEQSDYTSLPSTMSVFAVIYTLIVTLGVLGNTLVILSVIKHRSLQSVRNIFIVSLSVSDIVVCIVSGVVTPITAFTKVWVFGAALCKLVPLIQGASLCFSTLTLTAISIDRFILIIYPTSRSIQKRHAFQMIALNCTLATSISLPMFVKQSLVPYNKFCGEFCAEDWGNDLSSRSVYGTVVFILQFVVPFFIITFCYLMISVRLGKGMLIKRSSGDQKLSGPQSEQRRQALKRRLRTNRMLMAMVCVFLICWTPSVAFNFLRDYQWLPRVITNQEYLYGVITHCISISSVIWNPLLYALLNEQFRLAFAELLASCRRAYSLDERTTLTSRITSRCSRIVSNAFLDLAVVNRSPAGVANSSSGDQHSSRNGSFKWRYSTVSAASAGNKPPQLEAGGALNGHLPHPSTSLL